MKKTYAHDEMECPQCGGVATANFIDIGVGEQQCGPWGCDECQWVQETLKCDFSDLFRRMKKP